MSGVMSGLPGSARGFRAKLVVPLLAGCAVLSITAASAGASSYTNEAPAKFQDYSPPREGDQRIVGGTTTTAAYPWQAAIVLDEAFGTNDFTGQTCGGSLLTPRIVITAAHCIIDTDPDCSDPTCNGGLDDPTGDGTPFLDPDDNNVVLGRTVLSGAGGEEHNIEPLPSPGIYISTSYNPSTSENDVGFIVLDTASAQATIKVAGAAETSLWDTNSPTQVTGWGATSEGGAGSDTLRLATVPIISDADCANPLVYGSGFFPASMVCAGYFAGGTDSCQGDSGGPLEAPSTTPTFRLVGVVSFGEGCARVNRPGVYSRIAGGTTLGGALQGGVDSFEATHGLGDAGSVFGSGLTGAANLAGQSIIQPPPTVTQPPPTVTQPPAAGPTGQRAAALKTCKKRARKLDWSRKQLRKCKKKASLLPV